MRKNLFGIFLAVFGFSTPAFCSNLDYELTNNTNQSIVAIWASPSSSTQWIESTNVYVQAGGGSQEQTFDSSAFGSNCVYDIKMQFSSGTSAVIRYIDLCSTNDLEIDADPYGNIVYTINP